MIWREREREKGMGEPGLEGGCKGVRVRESGRTMERVRGKERER